MGSFAIFWVQGVIPVSICWPCWGRLKAIESIGFGQPVDSVSDDVPIPGPGVGSLQGQSQQLFILPQGFFGLLAGGDIPPGGDKAIPQFGRANIKGPGKPLLAVNVFINQAVPD